MKYSVIIPTWNNFPLLYRCLDSIEKDGISDKEIIVIVQPSTDYTVEYLSQWKLKAPNRKVIVNGENTGWTGAINAGFAEARGDYMVMFNDDTMVSDHWLDHIQYPFTLNLQTGAAGPLSNSVGGSQQIQGFNAYPQSPTIDTVNEMVGILQGIHEKEPVNMAHFLSGFCMMVSRKAYQSLIDKDGFFMRDIYFPAGFDDNDICVRIQALGYKTMISNIAFVHHDGSKTLDRFCPDIDRGMANFTKFLESNPPAPDQKLVAAIWCRTNEQYLERVLTNTEHFADAIVMLLDGREDATMPQDLRERLTQAHPRVAKVEFIPQDEPFNERNHRNRVLKMAQEAGATWTISIDGDECFELEASDAQRLMRNPHPEVKAYTFRWSNVWLKDDVGNDYCRIDDVFGLQYGARMFKVEPNQSIIRGTPEGLHCGNIPEMPGANVAHTPFRVLHFGYANEETRQRKYDWYNKTDTAKDPMLVNGKPGPMGTGNYGHIVNKTFSVVRFRPWKASLSVCAIVKNEGKGFDRWAANCRSSCRELVVVDTGSTDNTLERVNKWADRIDTCITKDRWRAREHAASLATSEWILFLDIDERMDMWPAVFWMLDNPDVDAWRIPIINIYPQGNFPQIGNIRLYRKGSGHWRYPIHEELVLDAGRRAQYHNDPAKIWHHGFMKDPKVLERKKDEYLNEVLEYLKVDKTNGRFHWLAARDLYAQGKIDRAISHAERAQKLGIADGTKLLGNHYLAKGARYWEAIYNILPDGEPLKNTAAQVLEGLKKIIGEAIVI